MNTSLNIVIRQPKLEDEPSARRMLEASISDAIRHEQISDLEEVRAYEISHKYALLHAALERGAVEDAESTVDSTLQHWFLIAELEGEVIGSISFGPSNDTIRELVPEQLDQVGELGSLYVRPDYQNQGIGSRLIAALLEELAKRGIDRFCLDSGYRQAQTRWRRKFGEPYKVAENHWGSGSDHVIWLCRVEA